MTEHTTAIKIIEQTDETVTVGGYGVVFGGVDLEGDTFESDTDYDLELVPTKRTYYDHTLHDVKHALGEVLKVNADEAGLWVEAQLDRSREYVDAVMKLIEEGILGWSSGSIAHLVRRDGGVIKSWPIAEFSLTPTPAEPRTLGVERIKQLAEHDPTLKGLVPKDEGDSSAISNAGGDSASIHTTIDTPTPHTEVTEMSENAEAVKAQPEQPDIEKLLGNFAERIEGRLEKQDEAIKKLGDEPKTEKEYAVPTIKKFNDWKYDNVDTGDLAFMVGVLQEAQRGGRSRQGASEESVKTLAVRLSENKEPEWTTARQAMKSAGIPMNATKANELNYSTQASYGDEWVGVTYSSQLWDKIRLATPIVGQIPTVEVPQGSESVVIPLQSTSPTFYTVAQAASQAANPGAITRTHTTSKMGTANQTVTVAKLGASVYFTGELEEDSLIPWVAELRRDLQAEAAEVLEHVVIDGDTETAATTNINDIGGTPAGTEAFMLLDGFRKLALITNTANSRDGGALAVEDYLETVKLMGLGGRNAADRSKVALIQDMHTHWKALQLSEVKTQDVFSAPTIQGGQLTNIWGYPVITSANMHRANQDATYGLKADATGSVDLDTASNNTLGAILAVRWDQWRLGWKRRIKFETVRVPSADATELVMNMRVGLKYRDTEAAAISYNITV